MSVNFLTSRKRDTDIFREDLLDVSRHGPGARRDGVPHGGDDPDVARTEVMDGVGDTGRG